MAIRCGMNSSHVLLASLLLVTVSCTCLSPDATTFTKERLDKFTPSDAKQRLERGNARFHAGRPLHRNLKREAHDTESSQFPFACVLSCIDSRTSSELIFDQGIGDIFNARVAGNVVSDDVIASLEYGCQHKHTKLIAVIGHTNCGAVTSAVPSGKPSEHASKNSKYLLGLLAKIKPAMAATKTSAKDDRTAENAEFVDQVAESNVQQSIQTLRQKSQVLREMEANHEIMIIGGMYSTHDRKVRFLK